MKSIFSKHALLPQGWVTDVRLEIDSAGKIAKLVQDTTSMPQDTCVKTLLPAIANLHSHIFQRAMAGMSERRADTQDSFWSWRDLMYRFLDILTPDDIEAIAALAFMEMQEAGFAVVGEFHYLHHGPNGQPYDRLSEMSERIFAAAAQSQIGLTHLPVLYTYGGAERAALKGGQRRFGNHLDRFNKLMDGAKNGLVNLPKDANIGIAPHSLRAIDPLQLQQLIAMHPAGPVHIHIAEQILEVQQISAWLGTSPVDFLVQNIGIDDRWCLIHATHMNAEETAALASCGAVAGLCPITEANLGDGVFNGAEYLAAGGAFGIGTDSNINISLGEELRTLEYSQRLMHRVRNVMAAKNASVGETLYKGAAKGGARALGRNSGEIKLGYWADLVAIDPDCLALAALRPDQWLDGWVFAASNRVVRDVWSAGRHCVIEGHHIKRGEIERRYRKILRNVLSKI